MNFQNQNFQTRKYDLEERTALFAEEVIGLVRQIPLTSINKRIIEQLVGASGSVGANYCEANEAESKKDFVHKISIAKKEAKETKHWLRLLQTAQPELEEILAPLGKEAQELILIFSAIIRTSKS